MLISLLCAYALSIDVRTFKDNFGEHASRKKCRHYALQNIEIEEISAKGNDMKVEYDA
jgi:hypothetical protein